MLANNGIKKGEEIFRSSPFIHLLMKTVRNTHCENCLQKTGSFYHCLQCQQVGFCSVSCMESNQDHVLECKIIDRILPLSDLCRIMVKLLLKLEKYGWDAGEDSHFFKEKRKFSDLLSHSDKLRKDDSDLRQLYVILEDIIPDSVKNWQYFLEVYGRLIINSFEINDQEEEKVGWGLFLAPSILNHSCVPNAEATFQGSNIVIKSTVNIPSNDISDVYISYIDISVSTARRREILSKYYYFHCMCLRCKGLKLSWVASEPFNPDYEDLLGQRNSVATAAIEYCKGRERDYLHSLRCQSCSGRPTQCKRGQTVSICYNCKSPAEPRFIEEYHGILEAVEKVLWSDSVPADAPSQCLELMTGVVHPYHVTYMACLELAIDDSILQNRLQDAADHCQNLLSTCRRLARGTSAHIELLERAARMAQKLGNIQECRMYLKEAQVAAYSDSQLVQQVLEYTASIEKSTHSTQSTHSTHSQI